AWPLVAGTAAAAGADGAADGVGDFCVAAAGAVGADAGRAAAAGALLAAAAAAACTSSPSPASTAISWLTGTSAVPSGTTIFASTPSSTASNSMVALSVSISAITSPVLTASPSFLSHLARLPFSMVGESAGMRMLMGIARSRSTRGGDGAGLAAGLQVVGETLADARDLVVLADARRAVAHLPALDC